MQANTVDRVLSCRTLPSLPGVALQLLDLTRDPRTPIDRIARLVQNDPALTAKILRTVNSSYYGLANPCPTISRAFALLGLNTIKSLVLGFSLVEMSKAARGFDLTAYWRRLIYSAAATRVIARRTGACDPEEAFIAALLQDVGMLALYAALGNEYDAVLREAPDDHRVLPSAERGAFGTDHAALGSRLAERWKLPPQFIECIRHHHTAETAPPKLLQLIKLVSLGMDAAAALALSADDESIPGFASRAAAWFTITPDEALSSLQEIAQNGAQLSAMLELNTGPAPDIAALLAEANEQLALHQIQVEHEANALQASNRELARQALTDGLTGASNRKHFDTEIADRFTDAARTGTPLAIVFVDADHFKEVNDTYGHAAGDAVLIQLARTMIQFVASRGHVCRYGGEEFAVILPGTTCEQAEMLGQELRRTIQEHVFDLRALGLPTAEVRVTISVGVAATDVITYAGHEKLVQAADHAAYAAKVAGRNRVHIAAGSGSVPAPSNSTEAGGTRTIRLLLIEDDPLAAKLVELMFSKQGQIRTRTLFSAEEALTELSDPGSIAPSAILCDQQLPGMQGPDLIRHIRRHPRLHSIPILAISQSREPTVATASLSAGADAFATKSELCSQTDTWVARIIELATKARRKAA